MAKNVKDLVEAAMPLCPGSPEQAKELIAKGDALGRRTRRAGSGAER
jgi:hypothetical protein